MNFEQSNILCDLEVLKEKLEDLYTTHAWHGDEIFTKPNICLLYTSPSPRDQA